MLISGIERLPVPEACQGCEGAEAIANRAIATEGQRVEVKTGIRVWSATHYAGDRSSTFHDAFGGQIDPTAARDAANEYDNEVATTNRELIAFTQGCPGIQAGQVCGRLVTAEAAADVAETSLS